MDSHSVFCGYGHFNDQSQRQSGSFYNVLSGGSVLESWISDEALQLELDSLSVNYFQPISVSEPENGSTPLSFTADLVSSQVYARQQDFAPLVAGNIGENLFDNISSWVPPIPFPTQCCLHNSCRNKQQDISSDNQQCLALAIPIRVTP